MADRACVHCGTVLDDTAPLNANPFNAPGRWCPFCQKPLDDVASAAHPPIVTGPAADDQSWRANLNTRLTDAGWIGGSQ